MALSFIREVVERNYQSYRLLSKPELLWKKIVSKNDVRDDENCNEVKNMLMKFPNDCTFLGDYCFMVADSLAHNLSVYDLTRDQPEVQTTADQKVWPNSVSATADGRHVVVSDRKENMIKVLDVERGTVLLKFGNPYDNEFEEDEVPFCPHGVATNSKGEFIVTDTGKHVVHIFTSEGERKKTFGSRGRDTLLEFCLPFYCAVDSFDNIIVSDNMNNCVKIFDPEGNFQKKVPKHLDCPYGISIAPDDSIVVADHDAHKILLLQNSGDVVKEPLTKMSGCRFPMGVAMGPCGSMVVTEASKAFHSCSVKAYNLFQIIP